MKKILKRGLSFVLVMVMVFGLMPVTAFAAVDSTGRPKDVNNTLVLSIYTPEGKFPGEPAVYGTSNYKNFDSNFKVKSGATFANSANNQLDWTKIDKDIVQGTSSGTTTVWGVYDANGTKDYFKPSASIIQPANEAKMIRAIKTEMKNASDDEVLAKYEIVWYVIKLQHSSGWRGATEWHIDGVIKERAKISINYYGNGNTKGNAPLGVTDHTSGEAYTILTKNTLVKEMNGVEVAFLGWSAKSDGTGAEAGFYQPGDVINPTESISLYAMWDTTTQYTATVNTYLDGKLTDDNDIHGTDRALYLSTDNIHFYELTSSSAGVYTAKITGNGKFHLYNKDADGSYTQIGAHQLTIYNQNGSLDVHHYSVSYDANGGKFATDPGKKTYFYGDAVTAITDVPTKEGYRFLGWNTKADGTGTMIQSGAEVTPSITEATVLYAQWEKTVNVIVNVTINHSGGDGYDQAPEKEYVTLTVASRENQNAPFLEVGETMNLTSTNTSGFTYHKEGNTTKYQNYTLKDMPGGDAEYTVVTSKSGYDTSVTHQKNENGDWIINVEMIYNPSNFDIAFTVKVDDTVPAEYAPTAAIVKVTFWATAKEEWEIITQQAGGEPGVRVDIDPKNRTGSGTYPVWKYESNGEVPYGYRIQVTSFVYPDGTIVPASDVVTTDVAWTDNVYTATVDPVSGGQTYGSLDGAYYDKLSDSQKGTLNALITMDLHNVTFDAQGGTVNGYTNQTVTKQYKIPAFKDYAPTRSGGYTFGGWYLDKECTKPATEGTDLTTDITLYAKWIEPLTISGTVSISGTYQQNDDTVRVNDIDKAKEAIVVLQEVQNGTPIEIDSETVNFGDYSDNSSANYSFTGIPNDGNSYQINVLVLNYNTTYDNESDDGTSYSANEFTAVFNGDAVADVDAYLGFVPPSYDQVLNVDATAIGEGFRPTSVLSEVMYRDTGDNHAFQRISQHNVSPYGVEIGLNAGVGSGKQSIWKWHTDGTLYDYQMNITKVNGDYFDSDTAPFYISYEVPTYWDADTNAPSGELKATLTPKEYLVTFDLNAGTDSVTGMDDYKVTDSYTDEEDNVITADSYVTYHTWSFDTTIDAVPERTGWEFLGWQANVEGAYDDSKIGASVQQNVILTAQWKEIFYQVTTAASPEEGGTTSGDGSYKPNSMATVNATAKDGYTFAGWFDEDGNKVSDQAEYTFEVVGIHNLTAKFELDSYLVQAEATDGGKAEGGNTSYQHGQTATVIATADEGYQFRGWYEGDQCVSTEATFSFTVTSDRTLKAQFARSYTVKAIAETGGTVSGGGQYESGANATLTATVADGYYFMGWYDEKGDNVGTDTTYSLTVYSDCTFTAKFMKAVSYQCDYVYLFGYNNSEIGAEGPLLRGELAQMIYRLVKQNTGADHGGKTFTDTEGEWFRTGISYMALKGAINDAKPNANPYVEVTRGETYKMICLGLGFTTDKELSFSEYATILRNSGYLDNDGRVTARIKRYEFCELFNKILRRENYELKDAQGNTITAADYGYTDLDSNASYYNTMMIATSTFTDGKVDLEKRAQRNPLDEYTGG